LNKLTISALIITILCLMLAGCSKVEMDKEKAAAYISANEDSAYEKTFKELPLGILYDYNLKVNHADKRWVKIWVEGYQDGEKAEPFHITEMTYGLSPNQVDEGRMGFGIINPRSEDALVFLYEPNGGRHPHRLTNNILINEASGSMWDYAIGTETIGLALGETKIIGVYRQGNSFWTYDYQDANSIKQMINEDKTVLLLKIKIEADPN
jgi:hypothetical protein